MFSRRARSSGPERLRFDFSHFEPVTREQLLTIERLVNREVRANHLVETRIMSLDDAKASGAMALFGEKYADQVRVLRMGDFSTELCGGTHVKAVGDIGLVKIVSESGIAAGVRRIEAITGATALDWVEADEDRLLRLAGLLKGGRDDIDERVTQLLERARRLEKELEQIKAKLASSAGQDLASQAVDIDGVKVLAARLDGVDPKSLRVTLDQLKDKLGQRGRGPGDRGRRQGQSGGRRDQGSHRPSQGRRSHPRGRREGRRQGWRATRHGPGRRQRSRRSPRRAGAGPRLGRQPACQLMLAAPVFR